FEAERDETAPNGPVVEVREGTVLRNEQCVEPAVVVQVPDRQATADARDCERVAGLAGNIGQPAPGLADEKLHWHGVREPGAEVVDMAVGRQQVKPAVGVGIEHGNPESELRAARGGEAYRRRVVTEHAPAKVLEEGGRLAIEICHSQVE